MAVFYATVYFSSTIKSQFRTKNRVKNSNFDQKSNFSYEKCKWLSKIKNFRFTSNFKLCLQLYGRLMSRPLSSRFRLLLLRIFPGIPRTRIGIPTIQRRIIQVRYSPHKSMDHRSPPSMSQFHLTCPRRKIRNQNQWRRFFRTHPLLF